MRIRELSKRWCKIIPLGAEVIPVFLVLHPAPGRVHDDLPIAAPDLVPRVPYHEINLIFSVSAVHQNLNPVVGSFSDIVINHRVSKRIFCRNADRR